MTFHATCRFPLGRVRTQRDNAERLLPVVTSGVKPRRQEPISGRAAEYCNVTFTDPDAWVEHLRSHGLRPYTPRNVRAPGRPRAVPESRAVEQLEQLQEKTTYTWAGPDGPRTGQFWCQAVSLAPGHGVWVIPDDAPGTLVHLHRYRGTDSYTEIRKDRP